MLHVASVCTPCCMMLHVVPGFLGVVAQSLKPVELLSQQLPTFVLFCDRRSVAQQCWIDLHSSSLQMVSLNVNHVCHSNVDRIILIYQYYGTMHFNSQHCWELLHPFTHLCQHYPTTPNIFWANDVGNCCVRLHVV